MTTNLPQLDTVAKLQQAIASLDEIIQSGVQRTNIDGVIVTFQTARDMLEAKEKYESQLRRLSGRTSVSTMNQSTGW